MILTGKRWATRTQLIERDTFGKAVVTDKNYNVISEVQPQGNAVLPAGSSAVAFSCEQTSEDAPEVIIRYITKGTPEVIKLKK